MCHFNKQKIVHDCRLFHKINQLDGNYNDAVQLWCFLAFDSIILWGISVANIKTITMRAEKLWAIFCVFLPMHGLLLFINLYPTPIDSQVLPVERKKKKLCQTRLHLIFCAIGLSLLWLQWIYITCRYYAICKNVPQTSLFRDRLRNIIFMKLHPTVEKV